MDVGALEMEHDMENIGAERRNRVLQANSDLLVAFARLP